MRKFKGAINLDAAAILICAVLIYAGIYIFSNLESVRNAFFAASKIPFDSGYSSLLKNKALLIVLLAIAIVSASAIYFLTKKGPEKTFSESAL